MSENEEVIEGEFMSEETAIIPAEAGLLAPAGTIDELIGRYDLQSEFIKKVLKEGVDYGKIPGATKPSLLKAGAEKITTLFGLAIHFPKELQERVEDWTGDDHGDEPFFFYEDTCQLTKEGVLIAEASGSCNSWEKKYRFRQAKLKCPACGSETIFRSTFDDKGWYCWAKKGGCGAKFAYETPSITDQDTTPVKNEEVFDQVNTFKKMSQKRALVAATLMAGNVSDYFTQDIEDMPGFESNSASPAVTGDPAEVKVNFPKAMKLFGGKEPTVLELFAKDASYCQWIYDNGKGAVADAMRTFIDTRISIERQSKETGIQEKPSGVEMVDAVENIETILTQTTGDMSPTQYWTGVRSMGIDEHSAQDISSACEGDWRLGIQMAVDALRGVK